MPSRWGCRHPHPSQTRTRRFPASGSSRERFARDSVVAMDDPRRRLAPAGVNPAWCRLLTELDRLQDIEIGQDGKPFIVRTPVTGDVGRVFQAVGLALPPNTREAEAVVTANRPRPRSAWC